MVDESGYADHLRKMIALLSNPPKSVEFSVSSMPDIPVTEKFKIFILKNRTMLDLFNLKLIVKPRSITIKRKNGPSGLIELDQPDDDDYVWVLIWGM